MRMRIICTLPSFEEHYMTYLSKALQNEGSNKVGFVWNCPSQSSSDCTWSTNFAQSTLKFLFSSLCCFPLSVEFSTFALSVSGSPFHYKLSVGLDLSFRLSMNCSYIYNSASALVDTERVSEILGLFFSDVIISIIYFLKELVKASFILNYRWRNWGSPRETRPLAITS